MKALVFPNRIIEFCRELNPARRAVTGVSVQSDEVSRAAGELENAMQTIEECFLAVGSTLESMTSLSRDLMAQGESLLSMTQGEQGGEAAIDAATQHIWHAIEFVERNDQRMDGLIDRLNETDNQVRETLGTERTLSRTIAPLNFIQTLFRVESAPLPHEVQEMFHALASDIDRIRIRVEGGFREKFELIREVETILSRAIAHLVEPQLRARQTVADLRSRTESSIATMRVLDEQNRHCEKKLLEFSQALNRETGQLVVALQFQDILNQKFQNIRGILSEMFSSLRKARNSTKECGRTLTFVQHSGRLAIAQLAAMKDELTKAGRSVVGGLDGLKSHLGVLSEDCLGRQQSENDSSGVDGVISILLESLAEVQGLVGSAEHHSSEAHQTIEPVGGLTMNFNSFMRELSLEIHLIGLNAEVQATHCGKGTGLEVLSAQTSNISLETSRVSESLSARLDELVASLDDVEVTFRQIRDENIDYGSTLERTFCGDRNALSDYRERVTSVINHISDRLPELHARTKATVVEPDFFTVATERIEALQEALSDLVTEAELSADKNSSEMDTSDLMDKFMNTYTMKSQVDVHQAILGGSQNSGYKEDDDSSAGDVEFFDGDAGGSSPMDGVDLWDDPAPVEENSGEGGDIILWDDDISAVGTESEAPENSPQRKGLS